MILGEEMRKRSYLPYGAPRVWSPWPGKGGATGEIRCRSTCPGWQGREGEGGKGSSERRRGGDGGRDETEAWRNSGLWRLRASEPPTPCERRCVHCRLCAPRHGHGSGCPPLPLPLLPAPCPLRPPSPSPSLPPPALSSRFLPCLCAPHILLPSPSLSSISFLTLSRPPFCSRPRFSDCSPSLCPTLCHSCLV